MSPATLTAKEKRTPTQAKNGSSAASKSNISSSVNTPATEEGVKRVWKLITENNIKIIDLKFNDQYVDSFIAQFRKTIEFAKLTTGDKIPSEDRNEKPRTFDALAHPQSENAYEGGVLVDLQQKNKTVLAQYSIPLAGSEATLVFTGRSLSPDDFDALADYVALFKKQFQRRLKTADFPKEAIYDQEGHGKRPITVIGCSVHAGTGEKLYHTQDGTLISESHLEFHDKANGSA